MPRNKLIPSLLASSALVLAATTPVRAGEVERAREAIAAADARIHTAETLGAGVEMPAATADARASLAAARENLDRGHRADAISQAIRASALADTAIGELQRRKNDSLAAAQAAERERTAAAQEQSAQTQDQVAAARAQAAAAQQQAADANARAAAAEQAAAQSAADAQAARNAAAAAQTQQVETTVTTQHRGTAHRSAKTRVTRRTKAAPAASDQVTTTTSVTQH